MGDALSVAEVLERAADLIEPEGAWMQDAYSNAADAMEGGSREALQGATCWCAEGAIARVLGISGPAAENWSDRNVSPLLGWQIVGALAWFNDSRARTQTEVVAKLREAAQLVRTKGDAA